MNKKHKETGHIISHTHWDREWRVPVWHARQRLIKMMDSLLEFLDKNPDCSHFVFDGQVVGIEDYLEFRPEKKQQVLDAIKNGRIDIGPWYNLPDEHPVYGEAMVRNLLTGFERANEMGGCLDIAYTTFGWGQTAQLPQIFAGFDIDFVVVGKHVSKDRAVDSEFIWQSPDGTKVLATRLGESARANFFFSVIMPLAYGVDYHNRDCRVKWGQSGWSWRDANRDIHAEMTCIPQFGYHRELLEKCMDDAWNTTDATLVKQHRFMGNGCDSTGPVDFLSQLIDDANKSNPDRHLKFSSLNEYADQLKKYLAQDGVELRTIGGELRDGPVHNVSANALATRMPLKILNRKAQIGLIRYAEPLASLAMLMGCEYPKQFIDKAWHYLLLAHSHDAINGVTLDKTADDTTYKLQQVIELAKVVTDISATSMLRSVDLSQFGRESILLAVFNNTARPVNKIVRASVDVPEEISPRWLRVRDAHGKELAVQPIGHQWQARPVSVQNSRALPFYSDRHDMYMETGTIPALGYKILEMIPQGHHDRDLQFWQNVYDFGSQVTGPNKMENKFLTVKINPNGTLNILHKASGKQYDNLHYFEDSGDIGDYWQRVEPSYNRVYSSTSCSADIYIKADGPLVTCYVCQVTMMLPVRADKQASSRDSEMVPLKITSELTLRKDNPYLEIRTTVANTVRDHRLRVCMPTYIKTDSSVAQGHFNVDKRPVTRPRDEQGVRDGGMGTLPMQHFVDLTDGSDGLALLNKDLIEYEVSDNDSRTLSLTLLRCMDVKICTEHRCATTEPTQDGPQCLGEHTFEYAIYPHTGNWQQGNLYDVTDEYVLPPIAYQFSVHDAGTDPLEQSMLTVEPCNIQIAAIKKSQDAEGIVVRLFNPTGQDVQCRLDFARKIKSACLCNMKEVRKDKLKVDNDGVIVFPAGSNKIVTILCKF